jgi:hypothetical protein
MLIAIIHLKSKQLQERTRALISRITVAGDTVIALDDTLQKPGFIQVMVLDGVNAQNGYMYIPGTSIAANLSGAAKSVSLDSVPAGMIMALCFAAERSSAAPRVITDSVRIQPGDTTIVPDGAWRFVRKIRLNTAQSGAEHAAGNYRKNQRQYPFRRLWVPVQLR